MSAAEPAPFGKKVAAASRRGYRRGVADSLPHKEISVNGRRSRLWSLEAAECPELKTHRIAQLGWHDTATPYARVRVKPEGSFFLACVEGEGRILLEGRAQRVAAGDVCLAPPRVLNAFRAVPGRRFEIGRAHV